MQVVAGNHAQCNLQTWHIHHPDYIRQVRKANKKDNKEGVKMPFFLVPFLAKNQINVYHSKIQNYWGSWEGF